MEAVVMTRSETISRMVRGVALFATGILAGAFFYARVAVSPTFRAVPMDVHLKFRVALMAMNAPFMQSLMGLAALTSLAVAVLSAGSTRMFAASASASALVSLLVTRFGNVPINEQMKRWRLDALPPDTTQLLDRWDVFHDIRTAAALLSFALLLVALNRTPTRR
jgi:uncharacterized membrane protein